MHAAAVVVVRPVCVCCWRVLGVLGPGYVVLGEALARAEVDFLVLGEQDGNLHDVSVLDSRVPVLLEVPLSACPRPPHIINVYCTSA